MGKLNRGWGLGNCMSRESRPSFDVHVDSGIPLDEAFTNGEVVVPVSQPGTRYQHLCGGGDTCCIVECKF